MGGCCSTDQYHGRRSLGGYFGNEFEESDCDQEDEEDDMRYGDLGARIRLKGSSNYTSMYTQQGRKGINQDAMTIWEKFTGEEDMLLCGVFDGHGPNGHKVARHVRDNLPSKLSKAIELSKLNSIKYADAELLAHQEDLNHGSEKDEEEDNDDDNSTSTNGYENRDDIINNTSRVLPLSSWEACFIKSFKELDEELGVDSAIDTYCSGSTAVIVVKQGDNLIIANLGDSRAILCSRGDRNQLIPIQLTVDLKPDIPSESERIKKFKGRVFAADEEPDVYRIWMPDDDCPGLAMARAFGDFCLKDYGLISIPDISYRRLTKDDQFVVLATDGIWDALTNIEVITIVSSARRRSSAARMLVNRAVQSWRIKYPGCKVDDCTAICLFFKEQQLLAKSEANHRSSSVNRSDSSSISRSFKLLRNTSVSNPCDHSQEWDQLEALQGVSRANSTRSCVSRANSIVKLPRFLTFRRSTSGFHEVEAH